MADPMTLLMLARDNKGEEIKAAILAHGISPNYGNQMGQTALHIASLWGSFDAAKALLESGANVNVENTRGQTPLHFAANARSRTKEICQLLLSHGAAKDIMDASGRVPYEMADQDDVRKMLGGPDGRLFEFALHGKTSELKQLLSSGEVPSIKVLDSRGRTALNIAVTEEHLEVAEVLLAHDPTCLDLADLGGDTALHCAVDASNSKILAYLLERHPHLNIQNMNPSEYAQGNWALQGEAIMPVDKTALHLAVDNGDIGIVTQLLDAGASVNILDFDKRSPLHLALENLDVPLIMLLLARGANANQASQDFVSPIHFAAQSEGLDSVEKGPAQVLQALLDRGADPTLLNADGWSPLHLAARVGNSDKAQLLLAAQAPASPHNHPQGNTPLHLAAINGHSLTCKVLLEYGADRSALNKEGKKPIDVAKNPETRAVLGA